jgi:hypothetical protein
MSKKLLKEAQVRRFMGLAGMQSNIVSNTISEMYGTPMNEEEEELAPPEEAPPVEDEMAPPVEDELPPEPAAEEGAADAEVSPEAVQNLRDAFEEVIAPLEAATGAAGEEPMPEPEGEALPEPEADLGGEELPPEEEGGEEEVFEGVSLELSEEEIVQEVSRRVAKRILEAKKAHAKMNKALGK